MKKMNILKSMVILGVTSIFVACAGNGGIEIDKHTKYLNKSELLTTFNNKTLDGYSYKHKGDFKIFYKADGTYKGTASNGKYKLEGVWKITDDGKKCETKKGKKERCAKYIKKENFYYTVNYNNDNITSRFTSK